jgi:signal transduction histidine kinase
MLLLTLTLLSFSSILYGSFSKVLYNDLDDLLSSRAEGVINSINAYRAAKAAPEAQDVSDTEGFVNAAGDWIETKLKDPELMSIFVRILNAKGENVISSKNTPRLDTLAGNVMEEILDGGDSFDTIRGVTAEKNKTKFRVYTRPVLEENKVKYIVQVVGSISLLALATKSLVWILFALLPLTVVLAGLPGAVLVRLTLKPVDEMIKTLKQTTAENLKLKIHLPDTKDEIKRLADTFNDMIERLDRSFSSQQSFIQDLSTELKTPLIALREDFMSASNRALSAQVAEEARATALSTREYVSMLKHGIEEMDRFEKIIKELETLAKFDNDRMALEIRKVNLIRLLERILADAGGKADDKDIELFSVLKDAIILDGDERQLKRLFSSILDNAIKYTNRKGKVTVSARKDQRFAVISVSDTGMGIEDGELPYIFDRFYQVKKSRTPNGSFGLGLSIAKSVADVHKGVITVESVSGKGSTFIISLPLSYSG